MPLRWITALGLGMLCVSASDRPAAEWVIRQNGRVMLDENRKQIVRIDQLPAGDTFRVTGVDLTGTTIEPKELEKIGGLIHLKELYLPGQSWNPGAGSRLDANDELKFLAGLKNLEKLHFSLHFLTNINVQDKGIAQIAPLTQLKELRCAMCKIRKDSLAPFVNLESLDLNNSTATDETLQSLGAMKKLRRLSLHDTLVSDDGMAALSGLTGLEELDLYGVKLTDRGVASLAPLVNLRKLNLLGSRLTDASAEVFAGMPKLLELNVYRSTISNAGLSRLESLKGLRVLDVRYSRVTSSGVEAFKKAVPDCEVEFAGAGSLAADEKIGAPSGSGPEEVAAWIHALGGKAVIADGQLVEVMLTATSINDGQLDYLSSAVKLRHLDLNATEVSDLGIGKLAGLTELTELKLGYTGVTETGISKLSGLTKLNSLSLAGTAVSSLTGLTPFALLRVLDLRGTPVRDESLRDIVSLQALEEVVVAQTDVVDGGLELLAKLPKLRMLDARGTDVGDKGLAALAPVVTLEALMLDDSRITDKGILMLKPLVNLKQFDIARTRATTAAVETLAALSKLERLNLNYTNVDDKGIEMLKALPNLKELRLDSANVTDAAVPTLSTMKNLKFLDLYHTTVSEKGFTTLDRALPDCKIVWDRDSALPNRRRS